MTLQELSKASSDEKPMNAYDQAKGLLCQEGGDQGPTRNDAIHEHEQNSPVTVNTRDFSHDELVVDEQDGSLMVTSDTNLGSASNVSWKSGKQDMTRTAQSPCDDPSVSCKALQNKGNSTSRNPKIDKQGLASMVVNIADRLGSNTYESKESLHLAVQASVLSLLESKDCGKGCYINMQYKDNALDAENKFQCTYCSKKKKTQCDLKYCTLIITYPSCDPEVLTRCRGIANTPNDILVHTAARIRSVPAASGVRMTGNATKIPCIGQPKPGNAPRVVETPRDSLILLLSKSRTKQKMNVARFSIGANNFITTLTNSMLSRIVSM